MIISEVEDSKKITDFYHKVNKFGTKLNRPEILRSEHFENPVQQLIEEISKLPEFKELELFTDSSQNRLIDQDYIGELLALMHFGITDKKVHADILFKEFKSDPDGLNFIEDHFLKLLLRLKNLNDFFPLKETRYKQKNDFYTLVSFLKENDEINDKTLLYLYQILIKVDPKISPSNEDCFAFKNYAYNCVTQSNSKKARQARLKFFEDVLLNQDNNYITKNVTEPDTDFQEILLYYGLSNDDLVMSDKLFLLPIDKI